MDKIAVSLLLLALLAGCRDDPHREEAGQNPARVARAAERGEVLYQRFCVQCHGERGDGKGKFFASELSPQPPDFTTLDQRDAEITAWIEGRRDRPAPLCPPMRHTSSAQEIEALALFLRALLRERKSAGK